jgi:hypothetical protein
MKIGSSSLLGCLMLCAASVVLAQTAGSDKSKSPPAPASSHAQPQPAKIPKANPTHPEKPQTQKPENASKAKRLDKAAEAAAAAVPRAPVTDALKIPMVMWPSPMTIHQGEPLAHALKGSSADVLGSFTYLPPLSYVPPRGRCAVHIRFDPEDPQHYKPDSATVWVDVL